MPGITTPAIGTLADNPTTSAQASEVVISHSVQDDTNSTDNNVTLGNYTVSASGTTKSGHLESTTKVSAKVTEGYTDRYSSDFTDFGNYGWECARTNVLENESNSSTTEEGHATMTGDVVQFDNGTTCSVSQNPR